MHSLFSNISRIRKEVGDADVPIHVPRAQFVRTLQKESSREIMREKIGVVYARMEKHLSESGGLLPVAWKALVKVRSMIHPNPFSIEYCQHDKTFIQYIAPIYYRCYTSGLGDGRSSAHRVTSSF